MFGFLAALLTYALLSFGGVLRHSWLTLAMLWALGVAVLLMVRFTRGRSLNIVWIALVMCCGLAMLLIAPKLGVGLLAAGWAYLSVDHGSSRVLRFFHFLFLAG